MTTKKSLLAIAIAISNFAACTSLTPDQIGSNHVAILSVTRWDDYKSDLQPNFDLSASQALTAAIPDTLQMDEAIEHAFQGGLALQFAPSSALPAGFGTGKSGDMTQTTPTPSTATAPPTALDKTGLKSDPYLQYLAATALFQEVKMLNRYVSDAAIRNGYRAYVVRLQVSTMPKKRGLAVDSYVDLSMFFNGYSQPISANTGSLFDYILSSKANSSDAISFAPLKGAAEAPWSESKSLKEQINDAILTAELLSSWKNYSEAKTLLTEIEKQVEKANDKDGEKRKAIIDQVNIVIAQLDGNINPRTDTPILMPLLVTDEVESALAARRADDLQQLSLSLAAAYAGIGGKVNLNNVESAMRSALGRDYNSLFSVARVNDNTVRVRLGARQTGDAGTDAAKAARSGVNYELTDQTHNISLLVLVPESMVSAHAANISFGAKSMFVDIATGDTIGTDAYSNVLERIQKRVRASSEFTDLINRANEKNAPTTLKRIASAAQNSQYDEFLSSLHLKQGDASSNDLATADRLWMVLAAERMNSLYDSGQFTVPAYRYLSKMAGQMVLLSDDGKKTTALIPLPSETDPSGLTGSLTIATNSDPAVKAATDPEWGSPEVKKTADLVELPASQSVWQNGVLTLTFPSLKNSKFSFNGSSANVSEKILSVRVKSTAGNLFETKSFSYQLNASDAKPQISSITMDRLQLAPDVNRKDAPNLVLIFNKDFKVVDPTKDSSYPVLTILGATLDAPVPADWTLVTSAGADGKQKPLTYIVKKDGIAPLHLSGLVPGTQVTFSLASPADSFDKSEFSLKVADLPKP